MSKVEPQQLKFDFGAYKGPQVPHCPLCGGALIPVGLRQSVLAPIMERDMVISYYVVEHYWAGPIYQCWHCIQMLGSPVTENILPWKQIVAQKLPTEPTILTPAQKPKHIQIGEDIYLQPTQLAD